MLAERMILNRPVSYANNLIEQDHRGVKQRIAVMLGFKVFRNAAITIAGIEFLQRIRKGNSDWDVWAFRAKLRLRSGTPCLGLEFSMARRALIARDGYLHQSP